MTLATLKETVKELVAEVADLRSRLGKDQGVEVEVREIENFEMREADTPGRDEGNNNNDGDKKNRLSRRQTNWPIISKHYLLLFVSYNGIILNSHIRGQFNINLLPAKFVGKHVDNPAWGVRSFNSLTEAAIHKVGPDKLLFANIIKNVVETVEHRTYLYSFSYDGTVLKLLTRLFPFCGASKSCSGVTVYQLTDYINNIRSAA